MTGTAVWQELSLTDLTDDVEASFMAVIASVPEGKHFSVNHIRHRLDAIGIPERQRGGLFARAVRAGLIQPATVNSRGHDYPKVEYSTGPSAHRAVVRVYCRPRSTAGLAAGGTS